MGRRGRPPKNLTPIDKSKMQLTDDIVNALKYNANLTQEQIEILKSTLDDTFKLYYLYKYVYLDDSDKSIRDINH